MKPTLTAQQTVGMKWSELKKFDVDWEGHDPIVIRKDGGFLITEVVECDYLPLHGYLPIFIADDGKIEIGTFNEEAGYGTPESDYDAWMEESHLINFVRKRCGY